MRVNFRSFRMVGENGSSGGFLVPLLSVIAVAFSLQSCGSDSGEDENASTPVSAASLVSDPQLAGSLVNASHGDAVSAAAEQGSSGTILAFADDDNDSSNVTKSCAISSDGLSAIVSTTSSVNRSRTKTSGGGQVTVTATRTGSGSSTRTWSKSDGAAVACNNAGTGAAINFQSPDNLKLEVSFERSRSDSVTYRGPRVTRSASKSFTSSGKRTVTWGTSDSSSDGQTYIRNKSVLIKDVNQSLQMTGKSGTSFVTALTINTAEASPLVVKVERSASSQAVLSKTFVSGEVVVKKDSDATMTTTYSNLKLNFADGSCSVSSGSAQIVIEDSAGSTLKTLTLEADSSGEGSLKDETGEEVEGFALDPCDSEDLKL